ncbi:deoxyhypusine hydroxylase-like [Lucilia sericata]|uniref:deoxyhypusine hydroxylase-like n=1 Tax=Lucilia sericata TaxID=13632 RepID=UPI0018A830E0|nr:deoxyhypusine hydroxylase-like [Lucilia sericata]XP_037826841.1 deoxyhypusine hydroxylase-like [Lucilia sericata]
MVSQEQIKAIGCVLNNKERPLKERFRALFTLKNIGGAEAIDEISRGFEDDSALLKHELAYCLGQMQDKKALGILTKVLEDVNQEPMVRHEAAEAMGAIGASDIIPILEKYKNDPVVEVAETCSIALDRVKWLQSGENIKDNNPYASVDPSPPAEQNKSVEELKAIYLDPKNSLFDRYRAMFSLRNMRTEESVLAITEGLKDSSALFRHEVAFVLGQLQEPCSIPYLKENLEDRLENEMVRHECAEALGAIASQECIDILSRYAEDEKRVVKESCVIALDMCEYENSPEFQYADGLLNLNK